jgi:aminoglycoside phosphotransferase (APT) family kinase protein
VLGGGLSNLSLLLEGSRGRYVLRLPRGPAAPGVSFRREQILQERAAAAGLAPPVLYSDVRRGWLVTPYLGPAGAHRASPGAAHPDDAARALDLLRSIHRLARRFPVNEGAGPARILDSPTCLQRWRRRLGIRDPLRQLTPIEAASLDAAAGRLHSRRGAVRVCHNDLLHANRIQHGQRLLAIDWEYACLGDPLFDLANLVSEATPDDHAALLALYLGRSPTPAQASRFRDQQRMQAAISACWFADGDAAANAAQVRRCMAALGSLLAVSDGQAAS